MSDYIKESLIDNFETINKKVKLNSFEVVNMNNNIKVNHINEKDLNLPENKDIKISSDNIQNNIVSKAEKVHNDNTAKDNDISLGSNSLNEYEKNEAEKEYNNYTEYENAENNSDSEIIKKSEDDNLHNENVNVESQDIKGLREDDINYDDKIKEIKNNSLPYKLWIDVKSRDWILEWKSKTGRLSVRKFSCKRWGKGKAYSHAMNFLASLTSGDILKSRDGNDLSGNKSTSVEDELLLQFLSKEEKQTNGKNQTNGLNALAAIAVAASESNDKYKGKSNNSLYSNQYDAASISSTGTSTNVPKPQVKSTLNTQSNVRGAVRKSGVPGVYWSQKPQGWRVVYYTGKDREFEYFKVPASASEEVINEILEVAKKFRLQVTSEGRHLPNGALNSISKRARAAERKAAAAAAAATSKNTHSKIESNHNDRKSNISDYISLQKNNNPFLNFSDNEMINNIDNVNLQTNFPNFNNPELQMNYMDIFYNSLLMNLYGNANVMATQQWLFYQNLLAQQSNAIQANSLTQQHATPSSPSILDNTTNFIQPQISHNNIEMFYKLYGINPIPNYVDINSNTPTSIDHKSDQNIEYGSNMLPLLIPTYINFNMNNDSTSLLNNPSVAQTNSTNSENIQLTQDSDSSKEPQSININNNIIENKTEPETSNINTVTSAIY